MPTTGDELSQQSLANALIAGGSRFDVAREAGQRVQEIGTADHANQLLAAHNRQPFDPMPLHHPHDLLERRLFGDSDGIGGHDLVHLAPMGAGIFVRKPARPDQEFEPTRSLPLRSGFRARRRKSPSVTMPTRRLLPCRLQAIHLCAAAT